MDLSHIRMDDSDEVFDIVDGLALHEGDNISRLEYQGISDLTNYYLKNETYTRDEVKTLIDDVQSFSIRVVEALPTTDIKTHCIYFVPKPAPAQGDVYDEYIYLAGGWELIGSTEINLDDYYTKEESARLLEEALPFKLGIDANGNYGYYKVGADTVTPFKTGGGGSEIVLIASGGYASDNEMQSLTIQKDVDGYAELINEKKIKILKKLRGRIKCVYAEHGGVSNNTARHQVILNGAIIIDAQIPHLATIIEEISVDINAGDELYDFKVGSAGWGGLITMELIKEDENENQ